MFSCVCQLSCVFSSCLFSLISSGLLVTPLCFCESALPCLALMSSLKTIIWVYSSSLCSSFLPAVCTWTEDLTSTVSGAHFTPFCFPFLKVFYFVPVFVSRGKEFAACHPALVWRDHRESSGREICSVRRLWLSPSPPAVCLVPGLPLPQARRIAADSSQPAAADPSPVDLVHNMARSAVCMSCGAHRNILMNLVLSCLRRLVESRRLMAEETIPSRLPLLSLMWKRLLRTLWGPLTPLSCPEEALASKLAQEGFLFLWVVLSCPVRLFSHGGRSCLVLSSV